MKLVPDCQTAMGNITLHNLISKVLSMCKCIYSLMWMPLKVVLILTQMFKCWQTDGCRDGHHQRI